MPMKIFRLLPLLVLLFTSFDSVSPPDIDMIDNNNIIEQFLPAEHRDGSNVVKIMNSHDSINPLNQQDVLVMTSDAVSPPLLTFTTIGSNNTKYNIDLPDFPHNNPGSADIAFGYTKRPAYFMLC